MRKLLSVFVLLLLSLSGMAADYYWVAGTGTWSNLNNWRLGSPTGAIPSIVPSSADNVIFGPPAGQAGNWVVTVDANVFCNNFTWLPGLTGNPRINRSNNSFVISVSGNVSLQPVVSYDAIGLDLVGSTNTTVMANGPLNVNMSYNIRKTGGAVVTFADDYIPNLVYNRNTITLNTGGLNVANRKITMYSFGTDQAGPRTMDITNATLELNFNYSAVGAGLVLSAAGSTINTNRFWSDGGTYHHVMIRNTNSGEHAVVGSTFKRLEFTTALLSSQARIANNNTIDTLIFNGWGSIRTSSNVVKYALFKLGGFMGGVNNQVQYAEMNGAFSTVDNATATFDTLITMPNKNIAISGTVTVNKLFRAGGAPCNGFTEISGNGGVGTLQFTAGATLDIDNVLLTNMTAQGPMTPVTVNGIDNEGNTGWNIIEPTTPGTTLYWVGGAGDWNDNAHWSTTSGGIGGACIPFINDNVVFNAGSGFSAGNNIITTSANAYCKDMTWSGVAANPIFNESGSFVLKVYGSVSLDPTVTMNSGLDLAGDKDVTFTTNGATLGTLGLNVRKFRTGEIAKVTFTDNWTNATGAIAIPRGGIDWTGRTMNINWLSSGGSLGRYLYLENAVITVNDWTVIGLYHVVNANNSYIKTGTITTRTATYHDVEVTGTAEVPMDVAHTSFGWLTFSNPSLTSGARILNNNTIRRLEFKGKGQVRANSNNIDSLILAPNRNFSFYLASNTTINKYFRAVHPSCSGLGEIRSGSAAVSTLNFGPDATVEIDNVYMENMAAAGGGGTLTLPISFSGADAGGNSGWTINSAAGGARYWVGGSGDWNDASHWSNTSGGPGGACIPTVSNDVFFDANSGFTAASKTVTIATGNAYFHNMDWTGVANEPILDKSASWVAECWGSMVLNPTGYINGQIRMIGNEQVTIAGSVRGNFDLDIIKTAGGSVTMVNDYANLNTDVRLTTGGFSIADRTISFGNLSNIGIDNNIQLNISNANLTSFFQYSGPMINRTLNAANSRITGAVAIHYGAYNVITVPGTQNNHAVLANVTIDSLVFSNPHPASVAGINGNSNTVNYVEYKGSGGIYGTGNIMGTLVFFPGNVYRLNGGSTNTITGEWFGSGTPCRLTEIRSTTTAQASIVKTSGDVLFDYVRLERSNATGGATFRVKEHSDDLGGNTGWTIEPRNDAAPILGLGADQELCASAFPTTLNTDGFFGAPGSVYTWSDGSTGETLTVTTPGTYRVSVTFPDGCNVKDTIKITQAVVPVDPIAGDAEICAGETKTLTNATAGGVWTTSDAAVATVDVAGVVTGVAAGNVTITYTVTSGAGCVNAVTHAMTVNALPVIPAITGTPDVCVGATTPLANTLAGGTWSTSDAAVAMVNTAGVVTGVSAGTAIITYEVTNAAGCTSSQTINITVNALPVMTPITGTTTVCEGATTTLSHAIAGGVWTSTNIGIAAVDMAGIVTGMSAGTADITYTVMNPEGCTASETVTITVNAPPASTPVTGTMAVCIGGNTTLANATPGGTWSSSNTTVATIDASGVVTGLTAGTTIISYAVNHAGGCVTTETATVTVSAPPTVSGINGTTSLCMGGNTTLTNATPGGVWASGNDAVATIDAAGNVTGIAAGTATISYTVTNATGCATSQSTTVTVYMTPVVAAITGVNTICDGDFTQLQNITPGGVWSSADMSIALVDPFGAVLGNSPGVTTISYTVTDANGCATVRTTPFTVNTPLIVAPITGSNAVCTGGTITLSSLTTGGTWASSNPAVASINSQGEVTGLTIGTTTISYQVTNSASCNAMVTFSLTVQSPTTVAPITGTTDICIGGSSTLANATAGGAWSSSDPTVATINASGEVTTVSAGTTTISYTLTEASGCTSTQTATITVHALPTVVPITGTMDVCVGATTALASATAGGSWTSSDISIATVDAAGVVTGVSAGTVNITYTFTNAAGCTADQVTAVTVDALPVVAAITGTTDVCAGASTILVSATAGGTWTSSDISIATVDAAGVVTGVSLGAATITYTVTNAAGCTAIQTAEVNVDPVPVIDPIAGAAAICLGTNTTFTNLTAGGTWSSSNTGVATIDAAGEVTAVAPGTTNIIYTVTSAMGCVSARSVSLTVNALPVVNPILGVMSVCVGGTTSLSSATTGGVWASADPAVATIDVNGEVTGVSAGTATISYTVTNAAGCVTERTATVTVNALPAVAAITGTTDLCEGATVQLASVTPGGVWSTSSTLVASINTAGEVQGIAAGTAVITYTVTNASGCEQSVTTTVTVNALPVVSAITGTMDVCVGSTTALASATAGGTWTSSDISVATVDAAGVVTGVSAGTADITYMVVNASGCELAVTATVTVNDVPVVDPITGTMNVCVDAMTTLESTTAGGVWSSSNTGVATIDAAGVVTGISAGTATISYTVTNASGCVIEQTAAVTVDALPVVDPIAGTTDVCVGATTTLTNTTAGGTWSSFNTGIATVDAGGMVMGVSAGTTTITYSVTSAAGCMTEQAITISVNALPTAGTITGTTDVCVAGTTTLANATTGGVWSSSDLAVATIAANGEVTAIAAGTTTITYTVTNASGCVATTTTTVTVNALPTAGTITGTTDVCVAGTTTLANATIGGVWSSSDLAVATIAANGEVTAIAAGTTTITYTVTNASGCVATTTTTVTVNALPTAGTITGTTDVCIAGTTTLANTTTGGTWSSSDPAIAAIAANGEVTAIAAGTTTITYTVTNASGCVAATTATVTVNALPTAGTITGTTDVCVAGTTTLANATTGGTWSSSDLAVATIAANGEVTAIAAGTTTITYTVTNASGCVATTTATVTVNALPTVGAITGTTDVCVAGTTTLANATIGGVWSSSDLAVATIAANGEVTAIAAGTTTITYTVTNASGCVATTTTTVTVNALPTAGTITGTTDVCVAGTTTLANATTGGTWSSSDLAVATIAANGEVTAIAAGTTTITYTVTNASGCVATTTANVTVNALPTVGAITGMTDVCVAGTTTLANTTTGGTWSSSDLAVATIAANGEVTAIAAGTTTITYTVTNASGCVATTTATVTVNALPTAGTITGTTDVCVAGTTTLANATTGGVWSSSDLAVATIAANGEVTAIAAGTTTITYTVTNASGCVATTTTIVTVNALPTAGTITGTTDVCVAGTTTLANATTGGTWSSSDLAVATIAANGEVTAIAAGTTTITYTVTNASGCVATTTATVTVNALPTVGIITGTTDVCVAGTTTLANATTGGVWSSSDLAVATIAANGEVTAIAAGTTTITYTVTNASGCVATTTATVTVNALPTVGTITGTTDVCVAGTTTLANATTGGVWSSSDLAVATIAANGEVTAIAAGTTTITYTVTNASGCVATTTATVTVNALPTAGTITGTTDVCVAGTTTLANATTGGTWSSSDLAVATIAANGEVTAIAAGTTTITYTVTSASGCLATTTTIVTVNALPTVGTITGTTDVCVAGTTTLANATIGGVWSSSDLAVATIAANGEVTAIAAGTTTITYTVTNASGCVATTTTTVTVNALPTAGTITGTTDVCIAGTTTLANTTTGGTWSSSDPAIAAIAANGEVTAIAAGTTTITYTVTNASGCVAATTATVTVNALPTAGTITGTTDVCVAGTTTLANATIGGVWSSSDLAVATIAANGEVTAIAAGTTTITYTVTNASGCVATTTTTVTVNALPTAGTITGTTDVCIAGTTTLANTTTGGTWSSSDPAIAAIAANGEVTAIAAGTTTITYTVTNASGCVAATTATVTVNALPTAGTITGTTDVCVAGTTTLANATTGGTWSSSDLAVATIAANGEVTAIAAGTTTITYTVTNASGCVATTTATVTVNALPTVGIITGTTDVCVAGSTTLANATTGGVWSSSDLAVATIAANGEVTAIAAGTTTITYTVTNASGCVATTTATVTVNALPTAGTITGTTEVCVAGTTTLANATTGGTWSSSDLAVATIAANGEVTAIAAGTTTITYTVTNASGCVATTTATVTVNALPTAGTITGTTDVCVAGTTMLANATTGGVWSSSDLAVATINAAGMVTGVSAGTVTITYTVGTGCIATATTTVTVSALPAAGTITGATTLCDNATTTLTSSVTGGAWSSSNPAVATIDAAGQVTGITAGTTTITYTVTNSTGCTASQTAIVTVNNCTPQVPPVAENDAASTYQDRAVTVNVAGNDRQDNGAIDLSSVQIVTIPANGTITVLPGGNVRYTPAAGFTGTDQFTYTIRNTANLTSNTATVTITVDVMPVAVSDTANMRPDQRTVIPVLVNDRGSLDPTTIIISRQPARGTLSVNADGTITFTPLPGFKGAEAFRYRVRDANGTLSNEAEVIIYVGEEDFFIPNAITPNGDGINDRFVIPDLHKFRSTMLTIFNRWGNEVYHNPRYDNRWDGNGLSGGTYYYILKVDTPQGHKVIKGWIQLLK
ncbi:Ig-like domain-containing protein [Chitinophaga pollutisoli]|uniref:Ig-like domain-containing protein n=1 Tax=Chitinophaga pollutisoli TaxID=3133966 RepID=A0ABZ2YS83_9BACT